MKDVNTAYGMTAIPARVEPARTAAYVKPVKHVCAYAILAMLIGYTAQLMNSAGNISVQEKTMIFAFAVTLLMVIPIIALNIYFVSRRRASNTAAVDSSSRSHAIKKEAAAWAIPIVIIAAAAVAGTWSGAIEHRQPSKPEQYAACGQTDGAAATEHARRLACRN